MSRLSTSYRHFSAYLRLWRRLAIGWILPEWALVVFLQLAVEKSGRFAVMLSVTFSFGATYSILAEAYRQREYSWERLCLVTWRERVGHRLPVFLGIHLAMLLPAWLLTLDGHPFSTLQWVGIEGSFCGYALFCALLIPPWPALIALVILMPTLSLWLNFGTN